MIPLLRNDCAVLIAGLLTALALASCAIPTKAERDRDRAQELRIAAERGDTEAAHLLANSYFIGRGVPRDIDQALSWYERAGSWLILGVMFEQGRGVERDYGRAAVYYRKGAERSDPVAQYALGMLLADGRGVPVDPVEALMWLILSEPVAKRTVGCGQYLQCMEWAIRDRPGYRARLRAQLTQEQVREAERRAAEWQHARQAVPGPK